MFKGYVSQSQRVTQRWNCSCGAEWYVEMLALVIGLANTLPQMTNQWALKQLDLELPFTLRLQNTWVLYISQEYMAIFVEKIGLSSLVHFRFVKHILIFEDTGRALR